MLPIVSEVTNNRGDRNDSGDYMRTSLKLLLGNLRTNRVRGISFSLSEKIKKKIISSFTNKHSVILPSIILIVKNKLNCV